MSKTLLPLVVAAARFRQYTLHYIFFETVTKTLAPIAENLVSHIIVLMIVAPRLCFLNSASH